jgi:hypothetical protein
MHAGQEENRCIRQTRQCRAPDDANRQPFALSFRIIVTTCVVGFGGQSLSNSKTSTYRSRSRKRDELLPSHDAFILHHQRFHDLCDLADEPTVVGRRGGNAVGHRRMLSLTITSDRFNRFAFVRTQAVLDNARASWHDSKQPQLQVVHEDASNGRACPRQASSKARPSPSRTGARRAEVQIPGASVSRRGDATCLPTAKAAWHRQQRALCTERTMQRLVQRRAPCVAVW